MSGKSGVPAARDPRIRPRDPRTYGPNAGQAKESATSTSTAASKTSSTTSKASSTSASKNSGNSSSSTSVSVPTTSVTNVDQKPSTSENSNSKKSSSGLRVDLHEAASDSPEQMKKRVSDWISVLTNSPSSVAAVGLFFRDYHGVQGISMIRAMFEEYLKIEGDSRGSERLLVQLQVVDQMLSTEEKELKEIKKSIYSSELMRDLTFFLPTMLFYAGLFFEGEICNRFYELLYTWVKRKFFYTRDTFNYLCRCFDEGQHVRKMSINCLGYCNTKDLHRIDEFHQFVQTRVHDISFLTSDSVNRRDGEQQIQRWITRGRQSMEDMVKNGQLKIDGNTVKEYLRNLPAVKAHAYGVLTNDLVLLAHTFFCSWLIDVRDSRSTP
ncbi:hypothetical protein FO519_000246 [Halicephalobus sp. NKZ332]|nr:hypothetical protein FO519_000246 [Halicephalobus sp. NKZ332]